jgi:hypothetical protein
VAVGEEDDSSAVVGESVDVGFENVSEESENSLCSAAFE